MSDLPISASLTSKAAKPTPSVFSNQPSAEFTKRISASGKRAVLSLSGVLGLWQGLVSLLELPPFILPGPLAVFSKIIDRYDILWHHTLVTGSEIILGLALGLILGLFFALQMLLFAPLRRWLLPILIASQAIPVFAIAPILMLWLSYGIASKIVMAALIIFFPVTTCCYDGLRQTPSGYLDLAKTMGATRWQLLRHIRLPAALPALASGIRVAVVVAPIGAVIGEWVGSSEGLGYLMLQANARMFVDEMFAALFILALFSVSLYFIADRLLKKAIPWQEK
ncbi:Hydroxymethylpyrimidine ABC transporter, transmembrane component [Photobacterium marinum]|uniref:Hydroxymethylpyrimidine ABC transporter, transmembrane component n=1 Tax=Photobacterium marinum TaxID=1056511 RepID=L8JBD1_9GAMM|nr:ABC transporter permease [Photobacterium marinum]ELR65568.1 Hydroxymethylpyrimidine ABC transporter, transmembrane component [Photobacterium marinum]